MYEQAITSVAQLHSVAQDAAAGTVPDACEK
jgi:hypothetical protein